METRSFPQQEVAEHERVEAGAVEDPDGVARRAHDGLVQAVERGIDEHRGPARLAELREQFASVERHDFTGELAITDAEPLLAYIASMQSFVTGEATDMLPVISERIATIMKNAGEFRLTTAAGCFVCH